MFSLSPRTAIVAACLCWALGTILSKTLLSSFSPVTVLVFQLAPSVVALWLAVFFTRAKIPSVRLLPWIGLLGLLNPGWAYTFSMFGLAETSASVATLLWAFEPILILGLAWLFLGERVGLQLVGLVAVASCGVLLVSGQMGTSSATLNAGSALILAGVLCCAVYTILARNLIADPLFTVAVQQSVAFAWVLAIWPLELQSAAAPHLSEVPYRDIATIILSGLLYYALAYWLYLHALRSMPASVAGSFFNLIPVFGVLGSLIFLGERLTQSQSLGAVLIVGAAIVVLRHQIDPAEKSQRNKPLSSLGRDQLDDLGITNEQVHELDRCSPPRKGLWKKMASKSKRS
ncbi:DMT family transporter [Mesorhizobium amorphae]|uniref:DMT family transporter n=1 Tax=Mesorhizobium amorphae TaxID=71433 RepID=UPI001183AD44|nr:DMT family transporter [Mesorhizobium amorphae]